MNAFVRFGLAVTMLLAAGPVLAGQVVVPVDGSVPAEPGAAPELGSLMAEIGRLGRGDGYVYVPGGTDNNNWPWSTMLGSSMRFQMLYLQSEIARPGRIRSFAFQSGNSGQRVFHDVTVKFCHTSVTSISTDLNANYGGNTPDTVYFTPLHLAGAGSVNGWDSVVVDWQYNNQDNLLVEVVWNGADPGPSVFTRCGIQSPTRRTWVWDWQGGTGVMADAYLYSARLGFENDDVGCTYIVSPPTLVDSGTTVAPSCSLFNYGAGTAAYPVLMRIGAYEESVQVTGHEPGTAVYAEFPRWDAHARGDVSVKCTTAFPGDANPANDYQTVDLFVRVMNVGALSITTPSGSYPRNTTITPAATWRNYGNTPANFAAWMCLTDPTGNRVYAQRMDVTNLLPNSNIFINVFPSHRLTTGGTWSVRCSTYQAGDMRAGNNIIDDTFSVVSQQTGDIGIVSISQPPAVVDTNQLVTPTATWRNYGQDAQGFRAWAFLTGPTGGRVYTEDTTIASLTPGGEVVIAFPSYNVGLDTGQWLCRCSTFAQADTYRLNDAMNRQFTVTTWHAPWPPGWAEVEPMPLPPSGKYVKDGAWLALGMEAGLIYASKGNKTGDFYSYDPLGDTDGVWTQLTLWPNGNEGKPPAKGACAVGDQAGHVYAVKGNNTQGFWRYTIDSLSWNQSPVVPLGPSGKRVKGGGDMTYVQEGDTGFVYLLKGYKQDFFRFNTASGVWDTSLPVAPAGGNPKWDKGSWLCYDGTGKMYAHKAKYHELWIFDVPTHTWAGPYDGMPLVGMMGKSKKSKDGGCATYDGGHIFTLKGGNTQEFWSLDVATRVWSEHETIPAFGSTGKKKRVKAGADIVRWARGVYFCLKGNKTNELWRYVKSADAGASLVPRSGVMTGQAAGGAPRALTGQTVTTGRSLELQPGSSGPVSVRILDISGRAVLVRSFAGSRGPVTLDLGHLPAGVYLVRLDSERRTATGKLILE